MAPTQQKSFASQWKQELEKLEGEQLRRGLTVSEGAVQPQSGQNGHVNMASNNYLGLAHDERVVAAAQRAAEQWGVGAGASRLLTGTTQAHAELEEALAAYKGTERALVFSSGYAANVGVLSALAGPRDHIFADRLNHASLIDGCRLTRAHMRVFRHGDLEHLEHLLQKAPERGQRLIVTDGVFSMDGELAPLPALVELAEQYEALLVVDDAHGTGVVGPEGRGSIAHFGLEDHVPVQVGTLSKALGAQGGFVAGSEALIDLLVNKARSFIYSTGIAPPVVAAAHEALRIAREEDERRTLLQRLLAMLRDGLTGRGYDVMGKAPAPMMAVRVGDPEAALALAQQLEASGIRAPAIRPPTVPEGTSRLRLAPMATHSLQAVKRVIAAFPNRA